MNFLPEKHPCTAIWFSNTVRMLLGYHSITFHLGCADIAARNEQKLHALQLFWAVAGSNSGVCCQ